MPALAALRALRMIEVVQAEALQARLGRDKLKAALPVYQEALRDRAEDWAIRENYAQLLAQAGDPEQAIAEYYLVVQQIPHRYTAYRQMGNLLSSIGNRFHNAKCAACHQCISRWNFPSQLL